MTERERLAEIESLQWAMRIDEIDWLIAELRKAWEERDRALLRAERLATELHERDMDE